MDKDYFLKRLAFVDRCSLQKYSYDLLPHTFKATDKVPISCHLHGVFTQLVSSHLFGRGCNECGRQRTTDARTLTTQSFIFKSKQRFGDKFTYEKTEYVKKGLPLTLTCRSHGDIILTPDEHSWSKHGCKKCDSEIPKQIRKKKVLEKAKAIHGNAYDYSRVSWNNVNDKQEIICLIHGSFWQSLYDHTKRGTKCPKCSQRLTIDDFIEKAKAIHGDDYLYDKVQYETNSSMVTITCKKHGDFIQRASSHLAGCKCKKCVTDRTRLSSEYFVEKAKAIHGNAYDYSRVKYTRNKTPVEVICSQHGSFWVTPNAHVSSQASCRLCYESKGEKAIARFLEQFNIPYIREYKIAKYLYRYDFYLPDVDIYIEFHGQQHYRPIEIFGGELAFQGVQERDLAKQNLVKQLGRPLIVLNHTHLRNGEVTEEIRRRLRFVYSRWYLINGKIVVFKTENDLCQMFNISKKVLISDLDAEVKKQVADFKRLI